MKRVTTAEDAVSSVDCGASVIAVSNHGGRVLDSMPGIAEVLRGVVQAVRAHPKGEKVVITADGGIRTGFDVLKMLVLGADLVLLGRTLAREVVPHGADGVKRLLEFIAGDIRKAMMTSCTTVEEIDVRILSRHPASE